MYIPPPILALLLALALFGAYEAVAIFLQFTPGHETTQFVTLSRFLHCLGHAHPWVIFCYFVLGLPLVNAAFMLLGFHLWYQ